MRSLSLSQFSSVSFPIPHSEEEKRKRKERTIENGRDGQQQDPGDRRHRLHREIHRQSQRQSWKSYLSLNPQKLRRISRESFSSPESQRHRCRFYPCQYYLAVPAQIPLNKKFIYGFLFLRETFSTMKAW